ncbi:glycosyl hydrolase [Hymenobacter cavernae]|uniref:glycosyl hydrolase n=1 Tax=Hymenobacter cavernae TaxID=2044852 RepID=UPI001E3FBF5F|nr:glycosyl hydrolase [Hymenobacter cavernae]
MFQTLPMPHPDPKKLLAAALCALTLAACQQQLTSSPTAASAVTTSASAAWPAVKAETHPWTRWWWMGNAVDEANIIRSLKLYADAGLGGVEITPIYGAVGFEQSYIDFLSPNWMRMLNTSVQQAHNLGLGVDMNLGTGWPYGGPQITPESAAGKLVVQTYEVKAGQRLAEKLVVQDPRQQKLGAPLKAVVAYGPKGERLDLLTKADASGQLNWQPSAGTWQVYAAFGGHTGQMVKRAAPGGAGLTMDHLSGEALAMYLRRFDTAFGGKPAGIRSFFNDSYEVYDADFSPRLFEEFQQRRGYDLRLYLRELVSKENNEQVARIRDDYRETMAEMVQQNFTKPWTNWIHGQKAVSRNQAHGAPGNVLDLYANVDIPECETFGLTKFPIPDVRYYTVDTKNVPPDPVMMKFATSAANVMGKPLASSETFTWLGEHFKVPLAHCKSQAELAFLTGVNHIFYHGTTYSPEQTNWPGWLFYASTEFAPSNSWWPHLEGLNEYITRCQSVLQAGQADNDVVMYWPVYDVRHNAPPKLDMMISIHTIEEWLYPTAFYKNAMQLSKNGYAVDFVSDDMIRQAQPNGSGLRVAQQGPRYKALIIPSVEFMPVETLANVVKLAQQGSTVILQELPKDVPGFHELASRRQQLKALTAGLSFAAAGNGVQVAKTGNGQIVLASDVQKALEYSKIGRETLTDTGLQFVRRNDNGTRYYYLVNHTANTVDSWVPLNTSAKSVTILDPQDGRAGLASTTADGSQTKVRLQIKPGESLILKAVEQAEVAVQPWQYLAPTGTPIAVSGDWKLHFTGGGPELPKDQNLGKLTSWTDLADDNGKRFSGTAEYTVSFTMPAKTGADYLLKLGDVRESAHVWINGQDAGFIWSYPYEKKVGAYLKKGKNTLKVEVANLMANRIIDLDKRKVEWRKYHEINFVDLYYKPFDASGWQLQPSGLLGPVTLQPLTASASNVQ